MAPPALASSPSSAPFSDNLSGCSKRYRERAVEASVSRIDSRVRLSAISRTCRSSTSWSKSGDQIEVDTPLVTLETDKATMDVPSTVAGKVVSCWSKGRQVSKGTPLVRVETRTAARPRQPAKRRRSRALRRHRAAAHGTERRAAPPQPPAAAHAASACAR